MESQEITVARAAYARYGAVTEFKNFQGNPMPTWEQLPEKIQEAWVAAANPPTYDEDLAIMFADQVIQLLEVLPNKDVAGKMLCAHYAHERLQTRFNQLTIISD